MYGFDKSPLDFVSFSCANIGSNDMGQFKYFIYNLLVIEAHYFILFIGSLMESQNVLYINNNCCDTELLYWSILHPHVLFWV